MLLLGVLNTEASRDETERMLESFGWRSDGSVRCCEGIRLGSDMAQTRRARHHLC